MENLTNVEKLKYAKACFEDYKARTSHWGVINKLRYVPGLCLTFNNTFYDNGFFQIELITWIKNELKEYKQSLPKKDTYYTLHKNKPIEYTSVEKEIELVYYFDRTDLNVRMNFLIQLISKYQSNG